MTAEKNPHIGFADLVLVLNFQAGSIWACDWMLKL
jgi:hypothetical protein